MWEAQESNLKFFGSGQRLQFLVADIFMHPRTPGMHMVIDGYFQILSFDLKFFVCRHVSI